MSKAPRIVDLRRIKEGLASAFAGMDRAISRVERMAAAGSPGIAGDAGYIDQDPRFRLEVVRGDAGEAPIVIELHEVAPRPKLVGFVELQPGAAFDLIDRLADRIGLDVYIAHKGSA
jgi:hypothetical protein